jgi:[ribosomal protein S5]-alanine N-acetyltransferase
VRTAGGACALALKKAKIVSRSGGCVRTRFPVLETERLVLREPRRSDAPLLLAAWQDEETMLYFGTEPLGTRAEALQQIRSFRDDASSGEGIRWVITERGRDEYAGDIGFFDFAPDHARAEIGFVLARPLWNRGLMGEALTAALGFGFLVKKLHRVEALVDPRNSASLRVLERAGFRREGNLRDYEFEREAFIDLVLLSLLQPEWNGAQSDVRDEPPNAAAGT